MAVQQPMIGQQAGRGGTYLKSPMEKYMISPMDDEHVEKTNPKLTCGPLTSWHHVNVVMRLAFTFHSHTHTATPPSATTKHSHCCPSPRLVMSDGGSAGPLHPPPSGQQGISAYMNGGAGPAPAPQHVNPNAAKLKFPEAVPASTKAAVLGYVAPADRRIHMLKPSSTTGTSYYGVKLDVMKNGVANDKQHYYACLASQACRTARKMLSLTNGSSSGATNHLQDIHKITMPKGAKIKDK